MSSYSYNSYSARGGASSSSLRSGGGNSSEMLPILDTVKEDQVDDSDHSDADLPPGINLSKGRTRSTRLHQYADAHQARRSEQKAMLLESEVLGEQVELSPSGSGLPLQDFGIPIQGVGQPIAFDNNFGPANNYGYGSD